MPGDFTEDERAALRKLASNAKELLEMNETYRHAGWAGWFALKLIAAIFAAVASVAAFKGHILALFKG